MMKHRLQRTHRTDWATSADLAADGRSRAALRTVDLPAIDLPAIDLPAIDLLAGWAGFGDVPRRALRPLAQSVDKVHVADGTVLARDEVTAHQFVLLVAGALTAADAAGRTRRLLPGATLGGAELLGGEPYHETITADGEADVVVVNGPAYRWAQAELLGGI